MLVAGMYVRPLQMCVARTSASAIVKEAVKMVDSNTTQHGCCFHESAANGDAFNFLPFQVIPTRYWAPLDFSPLRLPLGRQSGFLL